MFGTRKPTGAARCGGAVDGGNAGDGQVFVTVGRCVDHCFRCSQYKEVTILVLGDWQRLAQEMPPDTPVIFRYDGERPMENEDYCDGLTAAPSHMWEGRVGWLPCILVTLGERF